MYRYVTQSQPHPLSTFAMAKATDSPTKQEAEVLWSTGLCDCFSDLPNCCMTCWCPCVTFGQITEIVDRGSSSCILNGVLYVLVDVVIGCACLLSCIYRSKMREQYKLKGNCCSDCLTHFFCEPCALCQEYRELKNRGLDPGLGWDANMEKQSSNLAATTAPAVAGGDVVQSDRGKSPKEKRKAKQGKTERRKKKRGSDQYHSMSYT